MQKQHMFIIGKLGKQTEENVKVLKISPFRRESKLGNGQCFTNGNPKVDWMTGFAKSKLTLCQGQEDDEILGTRHT